LTAETQTVDLSLDDPELAAGRLRMLDDTTAERAMRDPQAFRSDRGIAWTSGQLTLRPYAVARITRTARGGEQR
jgi:hypothetical protein